MIQKKPQKSGSKRAKSKAKTNAKTKARSKPALKRSAESASRASKPDAKTKLGSKPGKVAARSRHGASIAAKPARAATGLSEGLRAPAFSLPRDGGKTISLADFAGSKLVVYFYPRADTPGCTREAMDFSRLAGAFDAAGAKVVGVSADPMKAQDAFRDKYQLGIPLISDEAKSMIRAYGAWGEKSMYGRIFEGIIRTTVLIGRDGKIARI